jgi:hypothetical protein
MLKRKIVILNCEQLRSAAEPDCSSDEEPLRLKEYAGMTQGIFGVVEYSRNALFCQIRKTYLFINCDYAKFFNFQPSGNRYIRILGRETY